jgi:hypothetical protein
MPRVNEQARGSQMQPGLEVLPFRHTPGSLAKTIHRRLFYFGIDLGAALVKDLDQGNAMATGEPAHRRHG